MRSRLSATLSTSIGHLLFLPLQMRRAEGRCWAPWCMRQPSARRATRPPWPKCVFPSSWHVCDGLPSMAYPGFREDLIAFSGMQGRYHHAIRLAPDCGTFCSRQGVCRLQNAEGRAAGGAVCRHPRRRPARLRDRGRERCIHLRKDAAAVRTFPLVLTTCLAGQGGVQ